jgi:hypothetical protein
MKTLIIDPFTRTITEAEHDGSLQDIYNKTHCDTFTMVTIDRQGGALFLDDEGLLKDLNTQAFFKLDTYDQALAGYAMVVGTNNQGETVATPYTVEQMQARIQWTTLEQIRKEIF